MNCYLTRTGTYLPGPAIANEAIADYLGTFDGEEETRTKILRMNGILTRHYALDTNQDATHDLYELGTAAALDCIGENDPASPITYLSAGTTNTPLVGPGISSLLHDRLAKEGKLPHPVEINSNAGICTASAQALINGVRAVASGQHKSALCIGAEQPSDILKSSVMSPPDDRAEHEDIRKSKWFMSIFLRSMLSDGAGAFLLEDKPAESGLSFRINWTYSRSFANQAPLCMKLENRSLLLSQDVSILAEHLPPCTREVVGGAFEANNDDLATYKCVLPHLSSYFFKRYLLSVLREFCGGKVADHWTNLETAGNTGAASIYIMLDEYIRTHDLADGDKIVLFIPESGQFNFAIISLTAVQK